MNKSQKKGVPYLEEEEAVRTDGSRRRTEEVSAILPTEAGPAIIGRKEGGEGTANTSRKAPPVCQGENGESNEPPKVLCLEG